MQECLETRRRQKTGVRQTHDFLARSHVSYLVTNSTVEKTPKMETVWTLSEVNYNRLSRCVGSGTIVQSLQFVYKMLHS